MSGLDLLFLLCAALFNVLVAAVAWRLGYASGHRQWRTDVQQTFDRGYLHGVRQERLSRASDPGLDDGEEWKGGAMSALSRQQKRQQRQRAAGRCICCAAPAAEIVPGVKSSYCPAHLIATRERARGLNGARRRNFGARSYHLAR